MSTARGASPAILETILSPMYARVRCGGWSAFAPGWHTWDGAHSSLLLGYGLVLRLDSLSPSRHLFGLTSMYMYNQDGRRRVHGSLGDACLGLMALLGSILGCTRCFACAPLCLAVNVSMLVVYALLLPSSDPVWLLLESMTFTYVVLALFACCVLKRPSSAFVITI